MKLNRTGSNWDRLERNKINENWGIIEGNHNKLEGEFNDVIGKITDEVVGHLIDSAKLDWKEPVDTVEDLPASAEVGETRMVREADPDGISYVYRYDGEKWEKIQAIDVTLVNEVDSRLTRQLADIAVNVKNFGALGNGSTDDTQAIQEAINYLTSEGGGTLFFPKGVYIVDFVFKIDVPIIVEGDGIGSSVIKVKEESKLFHNPTRTNNINDTSLNSLYRDYHAVFFINNTDFTIRNIELDGNGENQSEYVNGELWNYVSPSFKNGEADFYKYYHGIQVRLTDNTNKNITIEKCYIHHFNWNNIVIGNTNPVNHTPATVSINNNILECAGQDLLSIHRVLGVEVYQNKFVNPNSHGVHIYYGSSNVNVYNNEITHKGDVFTFSPNNPTNEKTSLIVGHDQWDENILKNIVIDSNRIFNEQEVYRVSAIYLGKTIIDLSVKGNIIRNAYQGISNPYGVLGNFNVVENDITYNSVGFISRPFNHKNEFMELGSIVSRPYKVDINLKRNKILPVDNIILDNGSINFNAPGEVSTNVVSSFTLEIESNKTSNIYAGNKNQFKTIDLDNIVPVANKYTIDSNETYNMNNVTYYKRDGFVHLVFDISKKDGTVFNRMEQPITLPIGFRPLVNQYVVFVQNDSGATPPFDVVVGYIFTSGQLQIQEATKNKSIKGSVVFYAGGSTE